MKSSRLTSFGKVLLVVSVSILTALCGFVVYVIVPIVEWSMELGRHIRQRDITPLIRRTVTQIRRIHQRSIIFRVAQVFSELHGDYRMWYNILTGREDFSDFAE